MREKERERERERESQRASGIKHAIFYFNGINRQLIKSMYIKKIILSVFHGHFKMAFIVIKMVFFFCNNV